MSNPPKFRDKAVADILSEINKDFREMGADLVATVEQAALRRIGISDRLKAIDKEVESINKAVDELNNEETSMDFDILCEKVRPVSAQIKSVREKTSKLLIPGLRIVN